jgi:hypothetical protein
MRYVRNGDIIHMISHYYKNNRVCQGIYFVTFASQSGMNRRIVAHST